MSRIDGAQSFVGNLDAPAHMHVDIPIAVVSEANAHTHWRMRQNRAKQQRRAVGLALHRFTKPKLPVRVTMTRYSPRKLDSDNLAGAFKHVRDEIAAWYGVDDGSDLYDWVVKQEKGKGPLVRICIESVEEAAS